MTIERTALPGVAVGHATTTTGGQRLGVISHLDGRREVVLCDAGDPDRAAFTVALESWEARHLADLLNATITIDHITDLERQIDGLTAAGIRLPLHSPYGGRPVRAAGAGTGVSIVVVVRDEQIIATPDPGFVLHHDDVVVVVGDVAGVTALTDLLATVDSPSPRPGRGTGRRASQAGSRSASGPVTEHGDGSPGAAVPISVSPSPLDRTGGLFRHAPATSSPAGDDASQ